MYDDLNEWSIQDLEYLISEAQTAINNQRSEIEDKYNEMLKYKGKFFKKQNVYTTEYLKVNDVIYVDYDSHPYYTGELIIIANHEETIKRELVTKYSLEYLKKMEVCEDEEYNNIKAHLEQIFYKATYGE